MNITRDKAKPTSFHTIRGNNFIALSYDQEEEICVQSHTTYKNTVFSLKSCFDARNA